MSRLVAVYLTVYLATVGWLALRGVRTGLPREMLPSLLMIVLPCGTGLSWIGFALENRLAGRPRLLAAVAGALGLLLIFVYQTLAAELVMDLLLGLVGWQMWTGRLRLGPTLGAVLCLALIYGTVWNLNYLLAAEVNGRLQDSALLRLDLWLYGLVGGPAQAEGMFPLTHSPLAGRLLENAYLLLYPQLLLVVFVYVEKGVPLGRLLHPLFACYLLGLLVFWAYPTVGPFTYFPASVQFSPDSATGQLMRMVTAEYRAAVEGGELNGAAYFIGVPSLHVAMAVLLQSALRVSRPHFWILLPINVLMTVSTVALGYHYLVDAPAGALLAVVVLAVFRPFGRAPADGTGPPRAN